MNPNHYNNISPIGRPAIEALLAAEGLKETCIDTIWYLESIECDWTFNLSSALKYLWRIGQKEGETIESDALKALTYLRWEYNQSDNAHIVRTVAIVIGIVEQILEESLVNN